MSGGMGRVMVGHSEALSLTEMKTLIASRHSGRNGLEALLIAGPTASGKSALAIELAKTHNGVVINADSMQVYGDLRIITARPSLKEEAEVPHELFGHVDGAINYSVGKWVEDMAVLLPRLRQAGLLPILTGGTGLYFKALTQGMSPIPSVPDEVRDLVRAQAAGKTAQELYAELEVLDPTTASKLRRSDTQRIIRALEVFKASGQPLAHYQALARLPALIDMQRCIGFFLAPEREALYERINQRFEAMMEAGALDEVALLAQRRLDPALPVMRAHGVPGLIAYVRREISLAEAVDKGQSDTRHYVKRQFTFARHQLPDFRWVGV
jgi:tRNA dimethylallyltransferase